MQFFLCGVLKSRRCNHALAPYLTPSSTGNAWWSVRGSFSEGFSSSTDGQIKTRPRLGITVYESKIQHQARVRMRGGKWAHHMHDKVQCKSRCGRTKASFGKFVPPPIYPIQYESWVIDRKCYMKLSEMCMLSFWVSTYLFPHHLNKGTRLIFVLLGHAFDENRCNHDVVLLFCSVVSWKSNC